MHFNGMMMNLLYSKTYSLSFYFPNRLYPSKILLVFWVYRRILRQNYSLVFAHWLRTERVNLLKSIIHHSMIISSHVLGNLGI